jgi:undecaprenyl-diphosphatase
MIDKLIEYDHRLFIWLNGFHAPWLDPVMLYVSETWVWLPLHAVLIYLIFKDFSKHGWLVLFAVAVTLTMSDQVTTNIMKPYFARLRPTHDPTLESIVHIVDGYRGGQFGFASSHAANTFALATFFFLLFRKSYKWIAFLFAWAALVAYSRVYLGVHFPGDILVGGMVGAIAAFIGFHLFRIIRNRTGINQNSPPASE